MFHGTLSAGILKHCIVWHKSHKLCGQKEDLRTSHSSMRCFLISGGDQPYGHTLLNDFKFSSFFSFFTSVIINIYDSCVAMVVT